jgi:hypothetical protein
LEKKTIESNPGVHDDDDDDDDDEEDEDTMYRTRSSLLPTACLPDHSILKMEAERSSKIFVNTYGTLRQSSDRLV